MTVSVHSAQTRHRLRELLEANKWVVTAELIVFHFLDEHVLMRKVKVDQKTILVVDNDSSALRILAKALQRSYEVLIAVRVLHPPAVITSTDVRARDKETGSK